MDFVFDRTVEGRVIKCLTIVDAAAAHEAVAIEVERALSGHSVSKASPAEGAVAGHQDGQR